MATANSDFVRLTGLFKTKKGGLVGTARPQDLKLLVGAIKEALAGDKGLAFFVTKSKFDSPPYYLSATVDQGPPSSKQGIPVKRRPIKEEGDFESEREEIDL